MFDYLVVGAGFAGSVFAAQMSRLGKRILLIDKRPHIAGNAYDHYDEHGILVHKYGPHIFHTNARDVYDFLSQFTEWRHYEHRVLASVGRKLVPVPINLTTVNSLYGLSLSLGQMEAFLDSIVEHPNSIRTSEDVVVSRVGRDLYEKLFRGYTRKQWGLDPSELDACVTARIPVRTNFDDRYFTDTYQAMPAKGYTRMFENMLDHPNITIELSTSYQEVINSVQFKELIFTGPVDEYFACCFGKLPYRSLEFRHRTLSRERLQPVAVINHPNEHPYTRVTEFKQLTGQQHPKTSIVYEYSRSDGDPYYPIPRPENAVLYKQYEELAATCPGVHFVGRLATYKYYNMDQVVAQALTLCAKLTGATRYELIHRPPAFPGLSKAAAVGIPTYDDQAAVKSESSRHAISEPPLLSASGSASPPAP
jgi:UDP-galactopyranose mutase